MLDAPLKKLSDPGVKFFASLLKKGRITANQLTLGGFVLGLFGAALIAFGRFQEGLAFILLNRVFDALDGARARLEDTTSPSSSPRGGFLDILCDFLFYASVPLAFAIANPPQNALWAALVIFSFVGTGSSFLAYAVIKEKHGAREPSEPQSDQPAERKRAEKAFFYIGGLTEATETTLFFVLICLLPRWFPLFAALFALLCLMTTATRAYAGWRDFKGS